MEPTRKRPQPPFGADDDDAPTTVSIAPAPRPEHTLFDGPAFEEPTMPLVGRKRKVRP
jgi:hypothetical protein